MAGLANHSPDINDRTLSESDRRELVAWAVACVRRLLPVFEIHRPDDKRLELAIETAMCFCAEVAGVGEMRTQAFECHAAARDCTAADARAVARACGQAIAIAHMAAHARNVPKYTIKAVGNDELRWQKEHLSERYRKYVFG